MKEPETEPIRGSSRDPRKGREMGGKRSTSEKPQDRSTLWFRSVDSGDQSRGTAEERNRERAALSLEGAKETERRAFGATPNIYLASAGSLFGSARTVLSRQTAISPVNFHANDRPSNGGYAWFLPLYYTPRVSLPSFRVKSTHNC